MLDVGRMVDAQSRREGERNHGWSPWTVCPGAMTPQWPSNRFYVDPATPQSCRSAGVWCDLPNRQWVVPTRHCIIYLKSVFCFPRIVGNVLAI